MNSESLPRVAESVLLVGALPPPFHGQAVMTSYVFDVDFEPTKGTPFDLKFSEGLSDVGTFSFRKISVLWQGAVRLLSFRWKQRNRFCVLYYCAGSANWIPLIRDVILLGFFGRLFSHRVVHFHSGGLVEWFEASGIAKMLGFLAYGGTKRCLSLTSEVAVPCFSGSQEVVVPNGLVVPRLSKRKPRSHESVFEFLYVGALRDSKGVGVLLEAVLLLRGCSEVAASSWRLVLVGKWVDSDERQKWENFVKENQLESQVVFRGQLTGDEKWNQYQNASAFVFPSYYESENQPLVLIEAMGSGLPIISTRWRGIPELVVEGETGFLVETKSPSGIANKMGRLLQEPSLCDELGRAAEERYLDCFSLPKFQQRIKKALCEW